MHIEASKYALGLTLYKLNLLSHQLEFGGRFKFFSTVVMIAHIYEPAPIHLDGCRFASKTQS